MTTKRNIVPVKKILKLINNCQDQKEIDNCKLIIEKYLNSVKKTDIENIQDLKERLDEEVTKKQEEIYLANLFNKDI